MIIDPYKREVLYRKAYGSSLREKYKEKLYALLGTKPEDALFLDLPNTDNLIINLAKTKKTFTQISEFSTLDQCIDHYLSHAVAGKYYLLLDDDWRYCGAYIASNYNLNAGFDFNTYQSDEVRLISTDLITEIALDYTKIHKADVFDCRISKYAPA